MRKQNINIDRLEVRLRGVSPRAIRATASDFGRELLQRLSLKAGQANQIDQIDSGTLQVTADTKPDELSSRMAEQVAAAIRSKLPK